MTTAKLTVTWFIALAILAAALLAPAARADGPNRTALLIVHGDGRQVSQCIGFDEAEISSFEVLNRSGVAVRFSGYSGMGAAVCAIDGEGCGEDEDCFCQCRAEPCAYWVYSHREPDGSWTISGVGAATWELRDGDVDGWIWGDGTTAPPSMSFTEICPPEAPEVATATPATTPEGSRELTETPSRSSNPTAVATRGAEEPVVHGEDALSTPAPRDRLPVNYFVFGGLTLGLVALLVIGLQRRR